jgi:hypothetical protein
VGKTAQVSRWLRDSGTGLHAPAATSPNVNDGI